MNINWKNMIIYIISGILLIALIYYLFVLPKLSTGGGAGVPLKSLYGY